MRGDPEGFDRSRSSLLILLPLAFDRRYSRHRHSPLPAAAAPPVHMKPIDVASSDITPVALLSDGYSYGPSLPLSRSRASSSASFCTSLRGGAPRREPACSGDCKRDHEFVDWEVFIHGEWLRWPTPGQLRYLDGDDDQQWAVAIAILLTGLVPRGIGILVAVVAQLVGAGGRPGLLHISITVNSSIHIGISINGARCYRQGQRHHGVGPRITCLRGTISSSSRSYHRGCCGIGI